MKYTTFQHPLTQLWHWVVVLKTGEVWFSANSYLTQEQAELAAEQHGHIKVS